MQMRFETKTALSPGEVRERALKFFGEGGYRLKLAESGPDTLYFTGGGGSVTISFAKVDEYTLVEFVQREWEQQTMDFVSSLPKP